MAPPPKVLLIEDDAETAAALARELKLNGLDPVIARRVRDVSRSIREHKPDLVVLDQQSPEHWGHDACIALRGSEATQRLPVILVSTGAREEDRVRGLELGADDYVVRPFSVRELALRVRALSRRSRRSEAGDTAAFGRIDVDRAAQRVFIDGDEVAFTVLEYKLLLTLAERAERALTREDLLALVWGVTSPVETETVDALMKRLRIKLGDAREYVQTVRGVGYRFSYRVKRE